MTSSVLKLLSPTTEQSGYAFDFDSTLDNQHATDVFDFDAEASSQIQDVTADNDTADDGALDAAPLPTEQPAIIPGKLPKQTRSTIPYDPIRIAPPRDLEIPLKVPQDYEKLYNLPYNLLRTGPAKYAQYIVKKKTPPPLPSEEVAATDTRTAPQKNGAPSLPHTPDLSLIAQPMGRTSSGQAHSKRIKIETPRHNPSNLVAADAQRVAKHYNDRRNISREARNESPIIGLKNFNNWIKTVLINQYCVNPLERAAYPRGPQRDPRGRKMLTNLIGGPKLRVLDMGCGKGGDLQKWGKVGTDTYVGVDVAEQSIAQALERYESSRNAQDYDAKFFCLDCFSNPLSSVIDEQILEKKFDVVSMQFCMHYAFQSPANARTMLENVSKYLRYGGMFLGTIPDAELLLDRLDEVPDDRAPFTFGNSLYQITFESKTERPLYGHQYRFFLKDAVDDVPEYVVLWNNFKKLASEYGLSLVYYSTFGDLFETAQKETEYMELMKRMKVVNLAGESDMDEEMWEAANIYVCFAFTKS